MLSTDKIYTLPAIPVYFSTLLPLQRLSSWSLTWQSVEQARPKSWRHEERARSPATTGSTGTDPAEAAHAVLWRNGDRTLGVFVVFWFSGTAAHHTLSYQTHTTLVPHYISRLLYRRHIQELDAVAREWIKPPRDAVFSLRVPVEFASFQASVSQGTFITCSALNSWKRLVNGPYVYLTSEDSFQIATMGVQGLRVEIASDGASSSEDDPP
jgi:hypothetical protein